MVFVMKGKTVPVLVDEGFLKGSLRRVRLYLTKDVTLYLSLFRTFEFKQYLQIQRNKIQPKNDSYHRDSSSNFYIKLPLNLMK